MNTLSSNQATLYVDGIIVASGLQVRETINIGSTMHRKDDLTYSEGHIESKLTNSWYVIL